MAWQLGKGDGVGGWSHGACADSWQWHSPLGYSDYDVFFRKKIEDGYQNNSEFYADFETVEKNTKN